MPVLHPALAIQAHDCRSYDQSFILWLRGAAKCQQVGTVLTVRYQGISCGKRLFVH